MQPLDHISTPKVYLKLHKPKSSELEIFQTSDTGSLFLNEKESFRVGLERTE